MPMPGKQGQDNNHKPERVFSLSARLLEGTCSERSRTKTLFSKIYMYFIQNPMLILDFNGVY